MQKRKLITCCASTDHGGYVMEGYATMREQGHRVAGKGHRVYCPKCNGIYPITDGIGLLFGYAPAVDGMRTTCGAHLIANADAPLFDLADDDPWLLEEKKRAAAQPPSTTPPPIETGVPGVSDAAFKAARTVDAIPIVLRIFIGNDGTGNNATNSTKALERCSVEKVLREHPESPDPHPALLDTFQAKCRKLNKVDSVSYAGGETNVHRLWDLYSVTRDINNTKIGDDGRLYVYRRTYVEGIGTATGSKDSLYGSGLGWGPTGVIARAKQGIEQAIGEVRTFLQLNPGVNIIIDAIEFDLCGFSRGAAATRHLANLIYHDGKPGIGYVAQQMRAAGLPFKPDWGKDKGDLRIRFIGLFETVAAIGIPDNGNNDPVKLFLADDIAESIVHLIAGDECRENFALNRTALSKHIQAILPGVHSDIGGGYPMLGWETGILSQPQISVMPLSRDEYDHYAQLAQLTGNPKGLESHWRVKAIQSDAYKRTMKLSLGARKQEEALPKRTTRQDRDWLIDPGLNPSSLGSGDDDSPYGIRLWPQVVSDPAQRGRKAGRELGLQVIAAIVMQRQVRGEYQLIPLRIMHALAQEKGVPFGKSPDDVPAMTLPDELVPIYQKLLAYTRAGGKDKELPLTEDEKRMLSSRYLHQSAHWVLGETWAPEYTAPTTPDGPTVATLPRPVLGPELIFVMRPAPRRERLAFDQVRGH